MQDKVLWSLDVPTAERAAALFQQVAQGMSAPIILMYLASDQHCNPREVESPDSVSISWELQEHGWLFCGNGELKWRRLAHAWRFVYLGTQPDIPADALEGSAQLQDLQEIDGQLVAWGLFQQGVGQDENLGQEFDYPDCGPAPAEICKSQRRWAFQIYEYLCPHSHARKFWRHYGMAWAHK